MVRGSQLSTLFIQRGESIDFVADGLPAPDTYSPLCGFKATLVLKQSGSTLAVGWYNADPARTSAPAASDSGADVASPKSDLMS